MLSIGVPRASSISAENIIFNPAPFFFNNTPQEPISNEVGLLKEDVGIEAMLQYLYNEEYTTPTEGLSNHNIDELGLEAPDFRDGLFHVYMYGMGDDYDIPHLRTYTAKGIRRSIETLGGEDPVCLVDIAYKASNGVTGKEIRDVAVRYVKANLARFMDSISRM